MNALYILLSPVPHDTELLHEKDDTIELDTIILQIE